MDEGRDESMLWLVILSSLGLHTTYMNKDSAT